MQKRGLDINLLDDVIVTIANGNKLPSSYKDHELNGKFKGFHECHIKPDWLLIYLINENNMTITLVNTGTHSDLLS